MSIDPGLLESAAQAVMAEVDCGRSVDPARVEWAEQTLRDVAERKAAMFKDKRFAAWVAASRPVPDEELPPALRGGALEAF